MKITNNKIEQFLQSPDKNVIGVLIYGPDIGLVAQRCEQIAKWAVEDINDPFNVVEINSNILKNNFGAISDEMAAISLMGGRRLVRFKDAANGDVKSIKQALDGNLSQEESFLIVTAGDLKPGSLRKLFESSSNAAALPCYADDIRSLSNIITKRLNELNLSFDRDIISYIALNCQGDRMIVMSEIDKLATYIGDKTHISFNDVKKVIGATTESNFDDICNAIAMGNHNLLQQHLSKSSAQGVMPIVILRSVQRFFLRLQLASGLIEQGQTQDQALKQLRPPVFFKQLPLFKQFLSKLSQAKSRRLWKITSELYDAELECKKTGANTDLMCGRALMKITSICK